LRLLLPCLRLGNYGVACGARCRDEDHHLSGERLRLERAGPRALRQLRRRRGVVRGCQRQGYCALRGRERGRKRRFAALLRAVVAVASAVPAVPPRVRGKGSRACERGSAGGEGHFGTARRGHGLVWRQVRR
jgi:hypothetical protein